MTARTKGGNDDPRQPFDGHAVGGGAPPHHGFSLVGAAPPDGLDLDRLARLIRFALEHERATGKWVVAVALVDDPRLQDLHREFMGIDEPTDVMTFPAGDPGASGGDIAVSVARATEQGPSFGHTPAGETTFLVVHGLLHLCGWDDPTPGERAAMLARQTEIIDLFAQRDASSS